MTHRTPQCCPHARVGGQGDCRWLLVEWMHAPATALDELTEAELLDHADEVSRTQRECEAQVLRIVVQHAILNNPGPSTPRSASCRAASEPGASAAWA